MSLSEKMTTLANTVRATIHHGVDYNGDATLLGLSDMVYRLNNFILRTNVPVFTNLDSTFVTKLQGGKQVFNSTKPINISTGVYPSNYTDDLFVASKSGTRFEQGITIETDGNVNLTDTKILFYLKTDDPHKEIDCQNIVKLEDNVYRLSTNGITTKENLMFEPFNINLAISNCTYIKFSELSFNVIGGVINPNLLPSQFNTEDWTTGSSLVVKNSEGVNTVQLAPNNSKGIDKQISVDLTGEVDLTSTYTWTFWARADNAGDKIHTELWGGAGYNDIPLTTEWKKYQSQGKFRQEMRRLYFWGGQENKGNVYVKLPYLYKN